MQSCWKDPRSNVNLLFINFHRFCRCSGETFISFQEAVQILKAELRYPEDRALHYVKKFDKNKDGRLSASEFKAFKNKIHETYVQVYMCLVF